VKAIQFNEFGDVNQLLVKEIATPIPSSKEVLVRLEFTGVNFIDIYQRKGYYPLSLPFTAGLEGAGVVEEVGSEVDDFQKGDRVAFAPFPGAYAEYIKIPAEKLIPLPKEISSQEASTLLLQGMTAHYLAYDAFPIKNNSMILIHAGAGGVGRLLTQMAKNIGATVITTVSSKEKAEVSTNAGADFVINYTTSDFEQEVMQITESKGVNVVYDSVGQPTFKKGLKVLKTRGQMVSIGQSGGKIEPFDVSILNPKGLSINRPMLGHYVATKNAYQKRAKNIFDLFITGKISINLSKVFPLEDASKAQAFLESRQAIGKVLLNIK